MALGNYPVWPFEPNWESSVGETLSWLTDVLQSPTGAEQRRSIRYLPRRSLSFSVAVEADERSMLDNLLMSHAADDWYLPLWYDVMITTANSTTISIPCQPSPSIKVGTAIYVKGDTAYDFQITEVTAITSGSLTVSPALSRVVGEGTIIHPMTVARLIEQPTLSAMSDAVEVAEIQFLVVEKPFDPGGIIEITPESGLVDEYRSFRVMTTEPDWSDGIERGQQRLLDTFDVDTGRQVRVDTANRSFPTQTR
jgi:hypothetical protein